MGSMGSAEHMEYETKVSETLDFEQIVKNMQYNKMFEP